MVKQKKPVLSNAKLAVVFFVFLIFFIGISLIFKTVDIIRAGQFDDSRRFTLTVSNGKNTQVISLSPNSKDIVIFKFNGYVMPTAAGKLLEIPIDGFLSSGSLDLNQKINSLFVQTILNYSSLKTNLTIIDLIKLVMLARSIPENNIGVQMVDTVSTLDLDKIVGHLVSDDLIEKDHQTIKIVNAADVGGLGNRLARLVSNMGGDVIIVATSDRPIDKSSISYIDNKNYTVEKLQKLLQYETVKESTNAISDITIVIGKDKVNSAPF